MKKLIILILASISSLGIAQVIIGDEIGTANDKTSVILEFAENQNKGIILPYVRTMPSGPNLVEGTILLDATNPAEAKVVYYNGDWVDLSSGDTADVGDALAIQPTAADVTEDVNAKVIIGSETTNANGVLVLESTEMAMVLPQVEHTNEIKNPAPGMMVYINKTGAKRLAIFNGSKWTYWKP